MTMNEAGMPNDRLISPSCIPAALHVCGESRAVAVKRYDLLSLKPQQARTLSTGHCIYFNFERDVLYLGKNNGRVYNGVLQRASCSLGASNQIIPDTRSRIKFLALCFNVIGQESVFKFLFSRNHSGGFIFLELWPGLEKLFLCPEQPRLNSRETLELRELKREDLWKFLVERKNHYPPLSPASWRSGSKSKWSDRHMAKLVEDLRQGWSSLWEDPGNKVRCRPEISFMKIVNG